MNPRRLYRSRDRQLAGVAGGMAEYLNIDPTVSRILWILAAIVSGGLVIIAYIALAIITPENPFVAGVGPAGWAPPTAYAWPPQAQVPLPQAPQAARGRGFGAAAIVGVVLIVFGVVALVDAVLPGWSSAVFLGPAVILALGAALLVASIQRQGEPAATPAATYQGTDTQPADPTALA